VKPHAVIPISVVLAALRIAGFQHEAFQAIAHLWVGFLIGAWFVGQYYFADRFRLCGRLVLILSLIETLCFLAGLFHHSL
jgi:uncharacterized membrane protein